MIKEQQQECSEIHTIQIFRDAPPVIPDVMNQHGLHQSSDMMTNNSVAISSQIDLSGGIGGDWAVEMDEDVVDMEPPSTALDKTLNSKEVNSSLYEFYFETPIVSMTQENSSDDYTITSHNTENFHDNEVLNIDEMEDFWEQGLDSSSSMNIGMQTLQPNRNLLSANFKSE